MAALAAGPILATAVLAADPSVVVQSGDTLTHIAKRQNVSIDALVDLNDLADPNRIYVGQRLRIGAAPAAGPSPTPAAAPKAAATVHVVQPGQNLTGIARSHAVTIAAIAKANAISNPSVIYAGQRLVIPGASPTASKPAPAAPAPTPKPAKATIHTVALGQTLTSISRAHGVSIAAIVEANRLADPSRIYAGQRLTIPSKAKAPTSASANAPRMPASMAALVGQRDAVRRLIVEEANRYKVPAAFALAVAWQESGWQQGVVSHAGAVGVMQLMPATAVWVGDAMLGARVDIDDTRQNVRAGVRLLAHYLAHYRGDRDRVLAAYYQGQWATDHHGIYAVSRPYIASIKVLTRLFGG
jgi:LysM repeat protein